MHPTQVEHVLDSTSIHPAYLVGCKFLIVSNDNSQFEEFVEKGNANAKVLCALKGHLHPYDDNGESQPCLDSQFESFMYWAAYNRHPMHPDHGPGCQATFHPKELTYYVFDVEYSIEDVIQWIKNKNPNANIEAV